MSNFFKALFEKLREESSTLISFSVKKIDSSHLGGEILEVRPSSSLVDFSMNVAQVKASKTMDLNQNLKSRTNNEKVSSLCRGILGETALQLLIANYLQINLDQVLRFDLERETFDYVPYEYDLSFRNRRIEMRTSNNNYSSIDDYVNSLEKGIICRYVNRTKNTEQDSDYFFAVVYDYPGRRGAISDDKRLEFAEDIKAGRLKMYLLAGANLEEKRKYATKVSLGQHNTTYEIINFSKCRRLQTVLDEMKDLK